MSHISISEAWDLAIASEDHAVLESLASHPSDDVANLICLNPATTPDILATIAQRRDVGRILWESLASHPNCPILPVPSLAYARWAQAVKAARGIGPFGGRI